MRILYIDIDTLRADHLGCYGYHRNTSPNIDALAEDGTRFDQCYVTDAPCLPSRTALWSGRCGFHNGVVNHGGIAAEPFREGCTRQFRDQFYETSWMSALRREGFRTVTVSPFGERHGAWHWYAGYNEVYNPGKRGLEIADDVTPIALDWIKRNARSDDWFLHVNYWDPHTPYRTPQDFGNPFTTDPLAAWLTEEVRQRSWDGYGPMSAREWQSDKSNADPFPRIPAALDSMEAIKQWMDGYDVGIRYADTHVGRLLNALADAGVLDDAVIMVSADHGENQGELNVWGDHQTADVCTCRVPLIVRWPGVTDGGRVDRALYYHYDWAATLLDMLEGHVPDNWDARPFTPAFRAGTEKGREYLIVSQQAWSCQRSVRFGDYLCLRTYHDGLKDLEPVLLYDLLNDPHEQRNLASERPDVVNQAMAMLADWHHEMVTTSPSGVDPMMTVLHNGGPYHTRGMLPAYLERLRSTGRAHHAEALAARHPDEVLGQPG